MYNSCKLFEEHKVYILNKSIGLILPRFVANIWSTKMSKSPILIRPQCANANLINLCHIEECFIEWYQIDGLVQYCSDSIANAQELLQSCS